MLHLQLQLPGRHAAGPLADGDELLHSIAGGHRDPELLRQTMRGTLDVAVRGLRRLRVIDIDIVLLLHGALIILDLVRVKDDDQRALPVSLIIAQDLDQAVSGRIQIVLCQRAQLLPVMDDIVAVDEQASRQLLQVYPGFKQF